MGKYKKAVENLARGLFPKMGQVEVEKYEEKGKTFEEFRRTLRSVNKNRKR